MKQILKIAIVAGVLLMPAQLSSIEPVYRPNYPVCIMEMSGARYLMWEPGGKVIKYEGQVKRSSKWEVS